MHGPGQRYGPYAGVITLFVNRILAGEPPIIFGDGAQVRDSINVDDVVRAVALAVESDITGKVLNIGTGNPCTVNELADMVLASLGSEVKPVHAPAVGQEIRYSLADTRRAEQLLGFTARKGLEDGIRETVTWLKSVT